MVRIRLDTKKPIKIWASELELGAEKQLVDLSTLPFIHKHVAVMPDAHAGKGSTVGTVIATKGAIIPSAVGVDIGCGMVAVKLPIKASDIKNLSQLRHSLERSVPVGRNSHKEVTDRIVEEVKKLGPQLTLPIDKALHQCGTLGGGNHFIEICADEEDNAWVMLHSGSRNIGKQLADIHIQNAKGLMKQYFIELPDPDLAYLAQGTKEFESYLYDLNWAQGYAKANRNEMMLRVLKDVSYHVFGEDKGAEFMTLFRVDCHHNYTSLENHFGSNVYITRKGAVSAKGGEYGIIPGSMGTKSYIVKGLGNPESFNSCSHGAGRKMSRTEARKTFSLEDLKAQTTGVECRKDVDVIDEIPGSYKNIDQVMEDQMDLVIPVYVLKQILCVKG